MMSSSKISRLAVGQLLEARERGVHFGFRFELDAQLLQALLEGVAARELAQHDLGGGPAHVFGAHDLVGLARLQHAVLVDARGVREGVGAHHRLVRLHRKAGDLRHHLRGRPRSAWCRCPARSLKIVGAGAHRHHHFFQRGVAGAFAQAVDGAFDLARAADGHAGQRVGHRQAKVVVAVDRPDGLVRIGNALAQAADGFAEHFGHGVADRVGEVDGGGAFGDHALPARGTGSLLPSGCRLPG